jgi:GTP-binding protein Era
MLLRRAPWHPTLDVVARHVRHVRHVPARRLPVPRAEKRLDVVILGSPNAGKSVLLNTLVQTKLAATTRKRHTTRNEILGVFNHRNVQLAFYDTPGFVSSAEALKQDVKTLRNLAAAAAAKADVALLVVDATWNFERPAHQDTFAEMAKLAMTSVTTEVVLVLNKVDLVFPKTQLLETTYALVSLINGVKLGPGGADRAELDTTTFMISALKDDGVTDLKNYLISISKPKPWVIPRNQKQLVPSGLNLEADAVTTLSLEERVEEIILEAMMDNTHEEIPYIADIACKSISNLTPTRLRIDIDIKVDSPSQQRIIVGQQGRTLLKIRSCASEVLERALGKQVILYLWVLLRSAGESPSSSSSSSTSSSFTSSPQSVEHRQGSR